jgi:hypothetical protein
VPLYVLQDEDGAPYWLVIDSETFATVPYTETLCGGTGVHDDPFPESVPVDAGASIDYVWGAQTAGAAALAWNAANNCTRITLVAPGSYTGRVCVFTSAPSNPIGAAFGDAGVPRRCVDTTIAVPSTGEALTVVSF